jgi:hypothetical protein
MANFQSLNPSSEKLDVFYLYLAEKMDDIRFLTAVEEIIKHELDMFQSKGIIGLILKYSGLIPDDDKEAREASARIIEATTKIGWPDSKRAKEYIGELGWEAVKRRGGWESICNEITAENQSIIIGQLREDCKTMIYRGRQGRLQIAPTIPQTDGLNDGSEQVRKLTEGIGKPIK